MCIIIICAAAWRTAISLESNRCNVVCKEKWASAVYIHLHLKGNTLQSLNVMISDVILKEKFKCNVICFNELCPFQNGYISALKQLLNTAFQTFVRPCQSEEELTTGVSNLPSGVHKCGFTNISHISQLFVKTMRLASLHFCLFVLSALPSLFLIGCMAPSFHPSMASSQWGDGIGFLLDKALPLVVVETMRWGDLIP